MASNSLTIKVGVELDNLSKIQSQLASTIKKLADEKIKLKIDADYSSLKTLQTTIKDINKSMTELSQTMNSVFKGSTASATTATFKESATAVKQTNTALKDQQGLLSQLKSLQNEEYSIKKQLITATGEQKATLEKNLATVMEQQNAVRSQLDTQGNLNNLVRESLKLDEDRAKKERDYQTALAKRQDEVAKAAQKEQEALAKSAQQMEKLKQAALDNMNTTGLSTKQIEEFKSKIESIDCRSLEQVKSELSAIDKEMATARNSVKDFANNLENIGKVATGIGDALLAAFAAPMAGLGYATKELTDFTYEMATVQAVSGATADEMVQLEALAKEMGLTTMHSATNSAEALKYMGWKKIA